jgi:CheY-like chemotaxis protein
VAAMSRVYRVALLGFSDFERNTLASYFRLAGNRDPRYEQVRLLDNSDFVIADSDHGPSVQLVLATDRLADTVFVGSQPPAGCTAWMKRPIDPLHVLRELDAMVMLESEFAAPVHLADLESWAPDTTPPPVAPESTGAEPREDAARTAQAPPRDRPGPGAEHASAHRATPAAPVVPQIALVVDDSEIARRFLETRLQPWGLRIEHAATSAQATELLAQRSYDLVFVDVELGPDSELDGLALCRQIKRSAAAVHSVLIVVSAYHSELDRARGALAGCDAYLAKPLDSAELARLLKRLGLKAEAPAA